MFSPIPLHFTPIEGAYQEPLRDVAARIWLTLRNICEYASAVGKSTEQSIPLDYMRPFAELHRIEGQNVGLIYYDAEQKQAASAAISRHWVALFLDLYAKEFGLLSEAMGYRLQIPAEATAAINDTLIVSIKTSLVALVADAQAPNDCLICLDENPATNPLQLSEAKLSNAQRIKLLQQWQGRKCECFFCKKTSAKRQKLYGDYLHNFKIHQPPFANFFGSALRNPTTTHTIDIISVGISQIPETIDQCSALRTFSITNGFVSELPEALFRLPNLQHLYLFKNRIHKLPPSIKALRGLLSLNINFNPIEELPAEIGEMEHLVNLVLGDCAQFRRLPAVFPNAAHLAHLDMSNTALEELPEWLEEAQNLQTLNLSNTAITAQAVENFPFQKLRKLRNLHIDGLGLRHLPTTLLDCADLETIYASNNEIAEIPDSIHRLKKLNALTFSNNAIERLPDSFCELAALTNFDLAGNPLQSLPANIVGMQKLSWARISQSVVPALGQILLILGQRVSLYKV